MRFTAFSPTRINVWPVVQRELREGARRPVNHRLRFGSAVVGTVLLWIVAANYSDESAAQLGGWLFASLHTFLLVLILLIVPALTADCIAREKRDGTLGLLFLTPLNAGGIVAGKALAQGLRAFTLWLAVLPILTIPFLLGGITWFDTFSALSLEFCATVLCLAAGLLASSLAKERNTAFILAFLLGVFFLCLFSQVFGLILCTETSTPMDDWLNFSGLTIGLFSGLIDEGRGAGWKVLTLAPGSVAQIWMWLCLGSPLVVLMFFYVVACFAARRIERSWQDKIPSPRRERLLRRYFAWLFRRPSRRKTQRILDWNPIAWLQQYSWKARLSKWGLCLVFLLIEWVVGLAVRRALDGYTGTGFGPLPPIELWTDMVLLFALAAIYTFIAVGGFLEEKRSGALELLLVTPISVNKLIFGRVWGLWKQFLPAGLVLAGYFLHSKWYDSDDSVRAVFILGCGFFALPVFATYSALRVKNLIVAAVLTWLAVLLPFVFAMEFIEMFTDADQVGLVFLIPALLFSYGGFARLVCFLLRHSLSRRIYSF